MMRIAVEAYPGYLASSMLKVGSYKNDQPKKQTEQQLANRREILANLAAGKPLGIRLKTSREFSSSLVDDPMADRLDAVICAMQASWAWMHRAENFGLPTEMDPLEGWIATVTSE
jgi:ribosome biogenesis protein Tsr3